MAQINRSDVIQKAVNDLNLQPGTDKIPTETLDKVQLTYGLNRQFSSFVLRAGQTTSGTLTCTAPTLGTGQEIYITQIGASITKDATCDMASGNMNVTLTPDGSGVSVNIPVITMLTTTAQDQAVVIPLPYPLKIKPNTNITQANTFTAGTCARGIFVMGFVTSSS